MHRALHLFSDAKIEVPIFCSKKICTGNPTPSCLGAFRVFTDMSLPPPPTAGSRTGCLDGWTADQSVSEQRGPSLPAYTPQLATQALWISTCSGRYVDDTATHVREELQKRW
jgi:hypothetical protein